MKMKRFAKKGMAFGLLFVLVAALFVMTVPMNASASSTIYIYSDGSVSTGAPIDVDGNTYTLTDNVYETIVIEKSGITITIGKANVDLAGAMV